VSAAETETRFAPALLEQPRGRLARLIRPGAFVWSATALFSLLFVAAAIVELRAFQGQRLDLGDMVQAVWSTAHGHFLRVTTPGGDAFVRLGVHADPFLALLAPLWWIWPSPLMLLVVQIVAVASGALPVYWLARKHLDSAGAAAGFAAVYLLYPATQYNALSYSGPHAVSFAVPLILFAVWFLDNDRLVPFAVTALLAAATKEEIGLAVGCLGIWYAVAHGRRLVGAAIFALGLAATLVDFFLVIPHFAPPGVAPFQQRYAGVGGTPGGIAHTLLTHPATIVATVTSSSKLGFLALLLLPLLGLWLLEPLLLLGALPDLGIDLLSSKPQQTMIEYHYTAGIVPFVVVAAVVGAGRIRAVHPARLAAYAVAVTAFLAVGHTPLRQALHELPAARSSNPLHEAKAHALSLVPAGVAVSATNEFGGYLSDRSLLYTLPHIGRARWAIVDSGDPAYSSYDYRVIGRLRAKHGWRVVYAAHGVEVLRKPRNP
jgi:uncharacterized membrane protein